MGFRSFLEHKRGVENVIEFQSKALAFEKIYYVHFGKNNRAYKHNNYICISLSPLSLTTFFIINRLLKRIKDKSTLLHSHNPLLTFLYKGKTDFLTVHDGLYYLAKSKRENRFKLILLKHIEKRIYKKTTCVHFISHFSKKMSLFKNESKYVIIPNTSIYETYVEKKPASKKTDKNKIYAQKFRQIMFGEDRIDLINQAKSIMKRNNTKVVNANTPEEFLEFFKEIQDPRMRDIANNAKEFASTINCFNGKNKIITIDQLEDVFSNGKIHNKEFLNKIFNVATEGDFANPEKFISQKQLKSIRDGAIQYVESIIDIASKQTKNGEILIDDNVLKIARNRNLIVKLGYTGVGLGISALFLSTIIPKIQYAITKARTGETKFPGLEGYEEKA